MPPAALLAQALDGLGFTPVGRVVSGMATVRRFYHGYGEMTDACALHNFTPCAGPTEADTLTGNGRLDLLFPNLTHILSARLVPPPPPVFPLWLLVLCLAAALALLVAASAKLMRTKCAPVEAATSRRRLTVRRRPGRTNRYGEAELAVTSTAL